VRWAPRRQRGHAPTPTEAGQDVASELARLQGRLQQAEAMIEIPKKVHTPLGIAADAQTRMPLTPPSKVIARDPKSVTKLRSARPCRQARRPPVRRPLRGTGLMKASFRCYGRVNPGGGGES